MKNRVATIQRNSAFFLFLMAGMSFGADPAGDLKTLQITVQSCDDEGAAFLFNAEARARFDSCGTPRVGFDVMLLSARGMLVEGLSDENGETVLGSVEVSEDELLTLSVCREREFCIHVDGLSVAKGPLQEGKNFVLHRDGSRDD